MPLSLSIEIDILRKELPVFRYKPTPDKLHEFGDGGVAIIDQWICVNARYFIGSEPSTFSYRIQGERLLMGFTKETTNNRLCYDGLKEGDEGCEPTSYWPPV
jgi:peptide-O-fucosyltransferase